MTDIAIGNALILWNSGTDNETPAFAIRPLGHDDYYVYDYQNGACLTAWRNAKTEHQKRQLMIELWHITAFYEVPAAMMTEELLKIPEYRDMLAQDCLPQQYQGERMG